MSSTYFATVGLTPTMIAVAAPKRTRIIFHPPANNRVTISENPSVTLDQGPTLQQVSAPILYDNEKFGDLPTYPWFAVANVAGVSIGISEDMGP